jgi:urocanate hydratase
MGGVARRSWARNNNAMTTAIEFNKENNDYHVTLPYIADDKLIDSLLNEKK